MVWKTSSFVSPTIHYTKKLILQLVEKGKRNLVLYADLHGHSNIKNVELYGCQTESPPQQIQTATTGEQVYQMI